MKTVFKRISEVCKLIFGYSIMITLFVGGLTFFGYIAALIAGGDTAVLICDFIYKKIIPIMIYVNTSTVLFGLVAMYLAGEFALTPDKSKKPSKSEGER
jgi:hypothetical protein